METFGVQGLQFAAKDQRSIELCVSTDNSREVDGQSTGLKYWFKIIPRSLISCLYWGCVWCMNNIQVKFINQLTAQWCWSGQSCVFLLHNQKSVTSKHDRQMIHLRGKCEMQMSRSCQQCYAMINPSTPLQAKRQQIWIDLIEIIIWMCGRDTRDGLSWNHLAEMSLFFPSPQHWRHFTRQSERLSQSQTSTVSLKLLNNLMSPSPWWIIPPLPRLLQTCVIKRTK